MQIGLVESMQNQVELFEDTKIVEVKTKGKEYEIIAENGKILTAKYVVLATHYPIINMPGYYFLKNFSKLVSIFSLN